MTILRVPEQFNTIGEAVEGANPRDTILVRNGKYREAVTVSKDGLRIIADGDHVMLDGSRRLETGVSLNEVSFVEIEGFTIKNFTSAAIQVTGGTGNQFVQNRIGGLHELDGPTSGAETSFGINLQASSRNLVWRNRFQGVCAGVLIAGNSLANRVVENSIFDPG